MDVSAARTLVVRRYIYSTVRPIAENGLKKLIASLSAAVSAKSKEGQTGAATEFLRNETMEGMENEKRCMRWKMALD